MSNTVSKVIEVINTTIKTLNGSTEFLEHLFTIDEQIPVIECKLSEEYHLPYQVYTHHEYLGDKRHNFHDIVLPKHVLERILTEKRHNGMSVVEHSEYTSIPIEQFEPVDYLCALTMHEIAHAYQLYYQDYDTDEDHTEEFYDVLEAFYDSPFFSTLHENFKQLEL